MIMNASAGAGCPAYPWLRSYPADTPWDMTFTARPVFDLLDASVARFPERPCTNFLGRTLTYEQIGTLVDEAARGLHRLGVKKGSKIGLLLPNSPTYIVYYYAILKCGATVVNFNPLYTIAELAAQISDSDTELIVTLDLTALFVKVEALVQGGQLAHAIICSFPPLLPGAKSVLFRLFNGAKLANPAQSPAREKLILEAGLKGAPAFDIPSIDPASDIAVLQFTGGTTGTPKAAMLTHANLSIAAMQVVVWAPKLKDGVERIIGILPFFHVFAMTGVVNYGIAKGAEIYIMPRFDLNEALQLITRVRPTIMPGVPTLFNAILHHPKLERYDLSSLQFCLSGGAPLPPEVHAGFEARTGCKLSEGYGLSETSAVVCINPPDKPVTGSIGLPVPGTVVSLRDLDDPSREAGIGERGELCCTGPQVMQGYYKHPVETAAQFIGAFLRTGDVATCDEAGYFTIVDRIKDLIICSGYNVYPRRIEDALYEHPGVEEAIVIGIKDAYRGEAPKAFVKLKAGATTTTGELTAHLATRISKLEMPAAIELRDSLPKTLIGKPSKKALQDEERARSKQGSALG